MAWPFAPLSPLAGYEVLVANPPLPFELYSERGDAKSYQRKHGSIPLPEIKALPVGHLVRGPAILVLAATPPMLDVGFEIIKAWGFVFKSEIVCRKLTKHGRPHRGTGYRVRNMHRSFLLATIGEPRHKKFDSHIEGRVRPDGAIPYELYDEVERCCPSAWRLDLFAAAPRQGWDSWSLVAGQAEPVVHHGVNAAPAISAEPPLLAAVRGVTA